jgi:ATP-dependent Lon protease
LHEHGPQVRPYVAGGVRDEAEIRGHRRTYIGALPGRLVRALRDAGTMNPVIMLDEVDNSARTGAAILRLPCWRFWIRRRIIRSRITTWMSNWIFSHVLFIATANVADSIPGPLFDRMEVIRFDGYTTDEKVSNRSRLSVAASARTERLRVDESRSATTYFAKL